MAQQTGCHTDGLMKHYWHTKQKYIALTGRKENEELCGEVSSSGSSVFPGETKTVLLLSMFKQPSFVSTTVCLQICHGGKTNTF